MRVLQAHNRALHPGGADVVVENEAMLLRSAGCEVEQFFIETGSLTTLPRSAQGAKAIWNKQAQRSLDERISRFSPDIVHVHTPFPLMSPAVFRTVRSRNIPAITTMHSFRYTCIKATLYRDGHYCEDCVGTRLNVPGVRHRCYKKSAFASAAMAASLSLHQALGTFAKDVSRYIVLSPFARTILIRSGIPANTIVVKVNSVPDISVRPERSASPYAAFVGRLEEEKGIETLLSAWLSIPEPRPRLMVVGDGSLRHMAEELASRSSGSIAILGSLPREHALGVVAGARLIVLPSEWPEPLPLVGIEALALGIPIVSSDLPTIADAVIPDVNGFRFRTGDASSLATTVADAWTDRKKLQALAKGARQSYEEHHSQEANLARLLEIYEDAIYDQEQVKGSGTS